MSIGRTKGERSLDDLNAEKRRLLAGPQTSKVLGRLFKLNREIHSARRAVEQGRRRG